MSRRSRRGISKREGATLNVARRSLPLPHESVHWLEAIEQSRGLSGLLDRVFATQRVADALRFVPWRVDYPPSLKAGRHGLRPSGRYSALSVLRMRAPARVRFCVRRKERREALFALGRAGYSGSTRGRYRRTGDSAYSCRGAR